MSGGDYHIFHVLRNWSKEHQISLIMPKLGYEYAKDMLLTKYSIYFSSYKEGKINSYFTLIIFYFLRILRSCSLKFKQSPDIIISSSHLLYDVLPAVVLRTRLKSKLVVYVHGYFLRTSNTALWRIIATLSEKFSLFLCKRADLIFVVNPDIKGALVAKGFQADKIVITGNGVERDLINSIKVGEKKFDGCFCGRIVEKKGVYDLVEIWERVLKNFPESKLVIIGDGPEYTNVMEIVKKKVLDKRIIFTGFVSETEKISLIKSCKIFVSPSYEESWGIAVSEAMACGLAIVCYNLSAYKIFGDSVIKVALGNKEGMVQSIIDLLTYDNNRTDLAKKGKELVDNMLNWDNISAEQFKEIRKLSLTR